MSLVRLPAILIELELEFDLLLERIVGLLLDRYGKSVTEVIHHCRRAIQCRYRLAVLVLHPHSCNIVRHISVEVTYTALGLMHRTISHPCASLHELIMIR